MSAKKKNSVDLDYLNSDKVKKGKEGLLEQAKEWKGGNHSERKEAQQKQQRDRSEKLKKRGGDRDQEKVSAKKQMGAISAIVFMSGAGLCGFVSTIYSAFKGNGITFLDVRNTENLKTVLFGGQPWLIYCVNNQTQHQKLPSILEENAQSLWSNIGVQVGVLGCWDETDSGRSVAKRFKMKLSPPLQFVVANGNTPRKLDLVGLNKAEDIEKKIKPALKVEIGRIDTLKKWPSLCTSRRTCIVVGHKQVAQKDTALNLIRPIIENHRGTKFVTVDTSFWQLKLDEEVLKTRPGKEGSQKTADVLCLARRDDAKGNTTHSGTFLQQLTASGMSAFVKACESRSSLAAINVPPRIQARPTKAKKVTPPKHRDPTPPPPRPRPREPPRGNVDRVGSRAALETEEEALFEAVEEEEEEAQGEDEENAEGGGDSSESDDEDGASEESTEEDADEEATVEL